MNLISEYFDFICPIPEFLRKYLSLENILRLKNIGYFCGMDYASKDIYDFSYIISRYNHSLSTALITWKITKSKKETLAALFHDVSTPCFSHVIDYMNKDYKYQESTEENHYRLMSNDVKLKQYLNEDNLTIDDIIDFKKYSIVDNNRPKLCADRMDGIFLTSLSWTKELNMKEVSEIIADIEIFINEENQMELGFKNFEIANKVYELNKIIDEYTHSNEDNYMMTLLSEITRYAIDASIITYDDLFVYDEVKMIEIFEYLAKCDLHFRKLFEKFITISKNEIPLIQLPDVKIKNLDPLVNGERLLKILGKKDSNRKSLGSLIYKKSNIYE